MIVTEGDIACGKVLILPSGWRKDGLSHEAFFRQWGARLRAEEESSSLPYFTGWRLVNGADAERGTVTQLILRRSNSCLCVMRGDPEGEALRVEVPRGFEVLDRCTGETLATSPEPARRTISIACRNADEQLVTLRILRSPLFPHAEDTMIESAEVRDTFVDVHLVMTQRIAENDDPAVDSAWRRLVSGMCHLTRMAACEEIGIKDSLLNAAEVRRLTRWSVQGLPDYDPPRLMAALLAFENKGLA